MDFHFYEMNARTLYLGERAKGNLFKPCLRTIPYTSITGALNRRFGNASSQEEIKAVGFLEKSIGHNRLELLTQGPQDRVSGISKIPLQIEFLSDVLATILVLGNEAASKLPQRFNLVLGGMRNRGFGEAQLSLKEKKPAGQPRPGSLRVRLPEDQVPAFGIVKVQTPAYGYLFKPSSQTYTGTYVRSLFEGSRVVGPEFLLEPERK